MEAQEGARELHAAKARIAKLEVDLQKAARNSNSLRECIDEMKIQLTVAEKSSVELNKDLKNELENRQKQEAGWLKRIEDLEMSSRSALTEADNARDKVMFSLQPRVL